MIWLLPVLAAGILFFPKKDAQGNASNIGKELFGPFLTYGPPLMSSIDKAALAKAKIIIAEHEGRRSDVYYDTNGFLTVGIGHKVVPADALKYRQVISDTRIDQFFAQDIQTAFNAAKSQAKELGRYTVDFIAALTSVNFQLGVYWRSKFKNTWEDLKKDNPEQAINRLKQSNWYTQTPTRVTTFIQAIQSAYA